MFILTLRKRVFPSILMNGITTFLKVTADKSNLSLDPEMDSYYMVEPVSLHLPNALNYLGQSRGAGSGRRCGLFSWRGDSWIAEPRSDACSGRFLRAWHCRHCSLVQVV